MARADWNNSCSPHRQMNLLPSNLPERRLSSLEPEPPPPRPFAAEDDSPFALKGSRCFSGNGRAIFVGLCAGAVLISVAGLTYVRHERSQHEAMQPPRIFAEAKHKALTKAGEMSPPAPVLVQVNSDHIHVTAIALGHPRLAVINGRAVAEGDSITVHTPARSVALSLRVVKIADGRIDLTDGTQLISAHLEVAKPTSAGQK